MDVEPLGIAPMPHAGLFRLAGARPPLTVDVLRQADVGDAGGVLTNQMHVGVEDGGVHWFAVLTQKILKVEFVKVHALHQVSKSFWLKGSQSRVTDSRVSIEIPIVDGFDQLLRHLYDLLFPS